MSSKITVSVYRVLDNKFITLFIYSIFAVMLIFFMNFFYDFSVNDKLSYDITYMILVLTGIIFALIGIKKGVLFYKNLKQISNDSDAVYLIKITVVFLVMIFDMLLIAFGVFLIIFTVGIFGKKLYIGW